MSHFIPKLSYGVIPTDIVLQYPPKGMGDPEELDTFDHTVFSISGVRQSSIDRIEGNLTVTLSMLTEALFAQIQTFYASWGGYGKPFRWFPDQNSGNFIVYDLKTLKFPKPKKIAIAGENAYFYEVQLVFRRVLDAEGTDAIIASILNNQMSPTNVVGVVLDRTSYSSVKIFFEIQRDTNTTQIVSNGYLTATYKSATDTWDVTPGGTFDGDDHGVTFSMNVQQLQYVSTNVSGANYTGQIQVKYFLPG